MTPRLRHLAPLVLILAACSAQPVSAPEQSAAAMTEEADVAPSTPALEVIAPGRAATWTQQYTDGTGTTWEVVLDKIECGLTSIPSAKSNPDWMGGPEIPQYVAATPAPGKDFCKAYLTAKNVGQVPDTVRAPGNLDADGTQYAPVQMMAWTVLETELDAQYASPVNPGDSTRTMEIYEVPSGKVGTGVLFPSPGLASQSIFLLEAR